MLLYNELPTAFPWYDKIGKQQRYRENAAKMCDYRLLNPRDRLLPFQFKIDYLKGNNMVDMENDLIEGEILEAGGLTPQEDNAIRTGFVPISGGDTIYYRTGLVFNVLLAYFTSDYQFISEHTASSTTGNTTAPSNAAFFIANVSEGARTAYNKIIFSISLTGQPENITPGNIVSWKISTCCGSEIDVSNNIGLLSLKMYEDGLRAIYKGDQMKFVTTDGEKNLNIEPGAYYSAIEFDNGYQYFSEVFTVPEDSLDNYMKIEFWNSCDIEPIAYNDGAGGWKQMMYIDSFIHASDPEVEEDGERDGNDMLIPTFQRMVVRYRFSAIVPDWMKIAIVSLQLHDNVLITTENETRSGRADRISTSTSIDDNGAYSIIDAIIDQYVMVKKACCSNIDLIDIP